MTTPIKILTDISFSSSSFDLGKNGDEFPQNPRLFQVFVKNYIPWIYTYIDGVTSWLPLTNRRAAYTHTQQTASLQWNIQHNLDTRNVMVVAYDENNVPQVGTPVFPEGDDNLIQLMFTAPFRGRAVVIGDIPANKTAISTNRIDVGNTISISESGITISGNSVITGAEADSKYLTIDGVLDAGEL